MRTTVKSNNSGGSNKTWVNYNNNPIDYTQSTMNHSNGSKGLSKKIAAVSGGRKKKRRE